MKNTAPQGGALLVFLTLFILGSVNHPSAQTLPVPWDRTDVGSPAAQGQSGAASGTFSLAGAGQVGGTADSFHFVYQQLAGDVDLIVRVNSLQNVDPWAKAGVMIRDGLGASVRHAYVSVSAGHGVNFERRGSAGADTRRADGGAGVVPVWLRLVRTGSDFAAYRSSNGTSWTLIGRDTISMRDSAYVGLAVASDMQARTATATFSGLTAKVGGLPAPWLTKAVGGIEQGDATYSAGVFTVEGAGGGFGGTTDKFQFLYQPAAGDVEITARLSALSSSASDGKAGVTIRAGLGKSARHVTLLASIQSGWEFRRRAQAGAGSDRTAGPAGRAPGWIRIVREGDLFSAYHSADGSRWTMVGSDRIPMRDTVYIGLAVSSTRASMPATAAFDHVLLRAPMTTNDPPQVSILSPAASTTFPAGSSITVKAAATDRDGVIAGVDFYLGQQSLGTDVTAPFAATVSAAPRGIHTLVAVARDSDGASTAASVEIVVGSTPSVVSARLLFVPSADHAKNVTSYAVSVYRASDSLTAVPLTKSNLGKPAPVNGEIEVDISPLLSTLPAGTYKVLVTAIGDGGSTPSAPSAPFGK